jgi:hypothetical protein
MLKNPLFISTIIFALTGALLLRGALRSMVKLKILSALRLVLPTLLCLSISLISAVFLVANHGYQMFTKEVCAATVYVKQQEKQRFEATVVFPDSTKAVYPINGDMLYIDAHILKWHPLLNVIGVHTTYELDRIGGRYNSIDDEREMPRTIYTLSRKKIIDMYSLRMRYVFLKPLLDAVYGSATFVNVENDAILHIMVSASGLLVRKNRI